MKIKDKLTWSTREERDDLVAMIAFKLDGMDFECKALISEYISQVRADNILKYRLVQAIANKYGAKAAVDLYSEAGGLITEDESPEFIGFRKKTIFQDVVWDGSCWRYYGEGAQENKVE